MRRRSTVLKPAETWCKAEAKAKREKLERAFELQLRAVKINYQTQFKWNSGRKWRADFYVWPGPGDRTGIEILVEIQGGTWQQGRHTRGRGYQEDCAKLAEAQLAHYTIFFGTAKHIKSGELLRWVERALGK